MRVSAHAPDGACSVNHMAPLQITEQIEEEAVRLTLTGELDLSNAYSFDRRVLDAEATHPRVLMIDLRGLTMLDSAGLARLVSAQRRARRGGWRLVLVRGGRTVQRVLQTTRLDELLELTSDPDRVLRELRPRAR